MAASYNDMQPKPGDIDKRYRITVTLVAYERPRYFMFNCIKCRFKVVELSGGVISLSDVSDIDSLPNFHPAPLIVKCRNCEFWYEFLSLSEKA